MVVNNPALLDTLRPRPAPEGRRRPGRAAGPRAAATFAGPAFLVSIGYMDPGNWGTDLAAGSHFGYPLLWVLVAANLTAVMLQYLSAKLGIATGQGGRRHPRRGGHAPQPVPALGADPPAPSRPPSLSTWPWASTRPF